MEERFESFVNNFELTYDGAFGYYFSSNPNEIFLSPECFADDKELYKKQLCDICDRYKAIKNRDLNRDEFIAFCNVYDPDSSEDFGKVYDDLIHEEKIWGHLH